MLSAYVNKTHLALSTLTTSVSNALTYLERAHESLVDTHHRTSVVKLATVVGRREESDELAFGEEFVAVLHHLMRATYEVQVVLVQVLGHHLRTERE